MQVSSRAVAMGERRGTPLLRWAILALLVAAMGVGGTARYTADRAARQEALARAEAEAAHERELRSHEAHLELLEGSVFSALDSLGAHVGPHASSPIEVAQLMSSNAVTKVPVAAAVAFVDHEGKPLVSGGSAHQRAELTRTLDQAARREFTGRSRVSTTTDPRLIVVERAMPGLGVPYHMAALVSLDSIVDSTADAAGLSPERREGYTLQLARRFGTGEAHPDASVVKAFGLALVAVQQADEGSSDRTEIVVVFAAGVGLSAALGVVIFVLAVSRDRAIQDRDRAMALSDELSVASDVARASARRLEDVLRASPDTVVVLSSSGDLAVLNRETFLGLPLRAIDHVAQLAALASTPQQAEAVQAAMTPAETTAEAQFSVTGSDTTAWYRLRRAPVNPADGSCVVTFTDVTREVEEEQRARVAEAHLLQTQRLESVGRLAGGVAHDVNNLLAAILAGAELASTLNRDADVQTELDEIVATAQRGAAVTRQLLQFSRRGEDGMPSAVVELDPLIRRAEALLRRAAGSGVVLTLTLDAPGATVVVDPTELEQVLLNLVVNARDAMDGSGNVEVRTSIAEEDGRPVALLQVADDGCGMDDATKARVFEPFFTTKAADKGTGLGLASVYGIVQRSHGNVIIDSTPDLGTTFSVTLPLQAMEPAADAPETQAPVVARDDDQRLSVLVVEDDPGVLRTTRRMLERLGHRAETARTGAEAVERCRVSRYDVLLVDVLLGNGASGPELAKDLRAAHRGSVGVLFMSGYDRAVVTERGVDPDAAGFVQKPFSSTDLSHALHEAARHAQPVGGTL